MNDRIKEQRAPSVAMIRMLGHLAAGRPWYTGSTGRSEHGGGQRTLYALKARGWIKNVGEGTVTPEGRVALETYK